MKALFILMVLTFTVNAQNISDQYQESYSPKTCMVFHFKHKTAEVFELVTAPTFMKYGRKVFRATQSFNDSQASLQGANFDSICDSVTRTDNANSSIFTCDTNSQMSYIVKFNEDNTLESATFKNASKTYQCITREGPFDA